MIIETSDDEPEKDEVEWLRKDPLVLFGVFFDKRDVWRGVVRLDQAQVCAHHVGIGVHLCKADGPDACPRGDVKDILG